MESHFQKLDGMYSPELVKLVRWCLEIDPLARPQSVFALQKVLQLPLPASAAVADDKPAGGWRAVVGKVVGRIVGRKTNTAGPNTLQS